MIVALLGSHAAGQPYVAAEGFGRPFRLGQTSTIPTIALAADGNDVVAYWNDREGVLAKSLLRPNARPERLLRARGVRAVYAVTVAGEAAVAVVQRDIDTGRTTHVLRWRGQEKLVLEAQQPYALALAAAPDGPAVLFAHGKSGESVLELWRWSGELREIARSEQTLSRFDVIFDERGAAHLSWLEGFNDRGAIGFSFSEWTAFYGRVDGDGPPEITVLGEARNPGVQSRTVVSLLAGEPVVIWPSFAGPLYLGRPGGPSWPLEPGTPIGVFDEYAYWIAGSSFRRVALEPATAEPQGEARNVVWAPTLPELAEAARFDGHLYLAWYGGSAGGGFAFYAADDRTPLVPGWQDRLAARMGWNPWAFWAALGGQLLASIFAAVMLTMILTPLFWLLSMATPRLLPAARSARSAVAATLEGIGISVASLLAVIAVVRWRSTLPEAVRQELFGTPIELAAAMLVAAGVTWLLRRKADSETQFAILASAWLSTAISLAILAFLNFQAWSDVWGGFL